MSQNVANLLYLIPMAAFILALRFLSSPRHARLRQPDRRARDARRDRRHAVPRGRRHGLVDHGRRRRDRRGDRLRRRAQGEDDRDAADGGAVQRRRRRRGGARLGRRVPQRSGRSARASASSAGSSTVLSALIGSISFAGSMVAFAKLQELLSGQPITFPGQQIVNGLIFAGCRRPRRVCDGRRQLLGARGDGRRSRRSSASCSCSRSAAPTCRS